MIILTAPIQNKEKKHGSQQLKEYDIFNKTQIINSDFDKFTKKINSIKK